MSIFKDSVVIAWQLTAHCYLSTAQRQLSTVQRCRSSICTTIEPSGSLLPYRDCYSWTTQFNWHNQRSAALYCAVGTERRLAVWTPLNGTSYITVVDDMYDVTQDSWWAVLPVRRDGWVIQRTVTSFLLPLTAIRMHALRVKQWTLILSSLTSSASATRPKTTSSIAKRTRASIYYY